MAKHSIHKTRNSNAKHFVNSSLQRSKSKKPLFIIIAIILILLIAFLVLRFADCSGSGNVASGQEITVTVEEGMNSSQIADLLQDSQVIASASSFKRKVKLRGDEQNLKPGIYIFVGGEDVEQIIDALVKGAQGATLVIPEGYRIKDIAAKVEEVCGISSDEFIKAANKASEYASTYTFLSDSKVDSLEGFLFPDTYTVDLSSNADDIVKMMLDNCASKLNEVDMTYASSKNLTVYDIVTLASIVEKESRRAEDMKDVAEVFYNRLHNGINLGSDVTTYYAVGKELTEELTKKDLASDNPYNTRNAKNIGLPPGAICSPGLQALQAVANPNEGNYLYFFYSQKEDKTMFFEDENSFNSAWAKYGE